VLIISIGDSAGKATNAANQISLGDTVEMQ
jgi:hypothetical protein